MKTIYLIAIIAISSIYSSAIWTQVATTTSETDVNQTLLNNAKLSREEVAKKNTAPAQEVRALGAGQNPSAASNLTDQEKQLSTTYIHQGKANQIVTDKCAGDMASVCNGNEGNHKFLGMDPNLIKAVSQAYAMFGALSGDSLGAISKGDKAIQKEQAETAKAGTKEGNSGSNGGNTNKKANDYCKFIPTATEGIATAVQAATTKSLSTASEMGNGDTAQKDSLLKAAKSHDSRAKMAQIQAAGWWGGAACYAINASTGQFATDKNLIIKMGAATLLGAFYQSEVSANKGYADKTRNIAKQLPGAGDCNPITDNLCYCSQASTENDPTYCLPGLHAKKIATTSYRVACTDDQLKVDSNCNCEKTNTCFDSMIELQSQGLLGIGTAFANSPFSGVRSLARGELVGGTISSDSYNQTAAIAKQGLRDLASKVPVETSMLTKDQKALADAMIAKGIPATVANLMAQNPPSAGAVSEAMAKLSGTAGGANMESIDKKAVKGSNVVDFTSGAGLGVRGQTKGTSSNGAEDILSQLKGGGARSQAGGTKVLEFAQKAENLAKQSGQIRKKDTPIFEIISLRYQTSGRRLLEVESGQ